MKWPRYTDDGITFHSEGWGRYAYAVEKATRPWSVYAWGAAKGYADSPSRRIADGYTVERQRAPTRGPVKVRTLAEAKAWIQMDLETRRNGGGLRVRKNDGSRR